MRIITSQLMNEKELIDKCKDGDSQSQRVLYNLYAPKMLSVCQRYVNDSEAARDVLHDGFIKVFTKIGTYAGDGAFAGWVRRIFVTTALEYLRKSHSIGFSVPIDEYENNIEDENISALSHLTANELLACIAELPSGYRTIFNMYAVEGYSHAEIATMLNIKEKTSQSQLLRARKILQHKVQSINRTRLCKTRR